MNKCWELQNICEKISDKILSKLIPGHKLLQVTTILLQRCALSGYFKLFVE